MTRRAQNPSLIGTDAMNEVRAALAEQIMVHRNNVALARPVRGLTLGPPTKYGLGLGSPDLIGCVPVWAVLVPEGTPGAVLIGRYAGFEAKTGSGRASAEQKLWHAAARKAGAFVAIVRDHAGAVAAIARAKSGLPE